jgi:ATP-dependent DNA helicase RecG
MQLSDKLEKIFRIDESQKKALGKLGLFSIADLLFYFPTRYSDLSQIKNISELEHNDNATIYGKISKLKTKKSFKSNVPMSEAYLEDLTGQIKIVWFHQPYLAKMFKEGQNVMLTGKVSLNNNVLSITNPELEKIPNMPIDRHNSLFNKNDNSSVGFAYPVYPESKGITSKWFIHKIEKILGSDILEKLEDYLPQEILKKYNLPTLKTALIWIHKPRNLKDAEVAKKRFAFEEVFCIQLERQHDKLEYRKNKSFKINTDNKEIENFIKRFPFEPTLSQNRSIQDILGDMQRNYPMSRLLEGDVGSGKTAVAATASYAVVKQRPDNQNFGTLQVAYMAPTEILATQHFESFIKYFKHLPINIGLITSSGCRKFPSKINPEGWTDISRTQLLKWVANGEISILIGTHSLIQKTVKFKHLGLVVIDEQHRFGTMQRKNLVRKDNFAPHLLSMTATPIPRTLALTIYGDLDLSLLEEMPMGRKSIITEIITPDKREEVYEKIRKELKDGRQVYVICPRIDEGENNTLELKSVTAEAKRLKKDIFKEYEIDILHSKMSKQKKEDVMEDFYAGNIDILCATSVVEVGVNVPNATVIIIEGAERFGLAQLHQLRGRVIRGNHQAYCYVFAEAKTEKTINRLQALKNAKNGFELSELDLALRGAGELLGMKQWGISDIGMEAIKNIKMVSAAREEAVKMIAEDPELSQHPQLKQKVKKKVQEFHFE